jgi:hypothetical protein
MQKWSEFYHELGATASCTIRSASYTANGGQRETDFEPNLFLGDSWFASVKAAEAIKELGHEFCGPVKTSHRLFPKKELEDTLKDWPGGTHLVLEAKTRKGIDLLAVGYKYNSSKVLCFVATKNAGPTLPGIPYRARFTDDYDNLMSRPVKRPSIISTYFGRSNCVDKHNQARQFELKLEKHWRTQNVWFRLFTTMVGIVTTDAWKAYKYGVNNKRKEKEIGIREFADRLAFDLLNNKFAKDDETITDQMSPLKRTSAQVSEDANENLELEESTTSSWRLRSTEITETTLPPELVNIAARGAETITSPLESTDTTQKAMIMTAELLWIKLMESHPHKKSDSKEKTGRLRRCRCTQCNMKTGWYCGLCNTFCCPELKDNSNGIVKSCYKEHIIKMHPKLNLNIEQN